MSQKFTKQNLRIKWITSFSLIFNACNTRDYTNTPFFKILLRDLILSINSTFPGITKNIKLNNLQYLQRSSVHPYLQFVELFS